MQEPAKISSEPVIETRVLNDNYVTSLILVH